MPKDDDIIPPRPSLPFEDEKIDRRVLLSILILCCLIELVLQLSDFGLLNSERLRRLFYEYGGFWPGLLKGWLPNYQLQPYLMFFTYSFLHSGLLHLVINMLTLWSLGQAVVFRVGTRGFLLIYVASTFGGAAGFALLNADPLPMVGASGALFGLAGALLAWMYVDRFTRGQGLLPVLQAVLLLIALNLALWWGMSGQLAWETHLSGFIMGWLAATLVDPRPAPPED